MSEISILKKQTDMIIGNNIIKTHCKNNKLVSRVRGGNHHTENRTKRKGGRCDRKKTKRKSTKSSFWDW